MPVINFSYSDLCDLIGREVSKKVLKERIPMIGADLKLMEDASDEMSFEFFPDRPDLYSVEGIARALRAFLGFEPGLRSYSVGESNVDIRVDPIVETVRPFIWTALVEGNEMTDPLIRSMMDLQEKLHLTLGRNRKKVAIGIHDHATVKPPFTYTAVEPDGIEFVPLQGSRKMTPEEILKEHEKGKAYASVLEGKSRYPMILDRDGVVLSFPPIINGVTTAITEDTKDIFVDCTGTDLNAVQASVNILTTALAERGGKVKTVRVLRGSHVELAPDLKSRGMALDVDYANGWNGTALRPEETAECLRRMGFGASLSGKAIDVSVPAYRADILHPVDLAEDVAIGYGFEKFGTQLPSRATFGEEVELERFSSSLRTVMIGLGYMEVATLSLSNPREQFEAMNLDPESPSIRVRNPVSQEHVLLRTSLLPSLLATLRKNKHRELPQRIFEIGEVVTGVRNRRLLSGMSIHAKASFTEGKSLVQGILASTGLRFEVAAAANPSFISGRCAKALDGVDQLGVFGELAPSTLEAFELKYPVVAFELDAHKLFDIVKRSS